jgi:medium-chain acyl-[acyl-carrier-protein] hydrolase
VKLYCIPYAGSSARVYAGWQQRVTGPVEVVPLELPGRGTLCTRPPLDTLEALTGHLADAVEAGGTDAYAIFGHSFGAVIGFELARTLEARRAAPPAAVIVSACPPPHRFPLGPPVHTLSDEELKQHLGKLRGTPPELLENDELLALYLPSLRADYRILDTYRAAQDASVAAPVLALTGTYDEVDDAAVAAWAGCTTGEFRSASVTGDHFFLTASEDQVVDHVVRMLRDVSR